MIREIRDKKITRKDIYAKYFSLCDTGECITEDFAKDIQEAKEIFSNKSKVNVLIRGNVFTPNGELKYFTFVDEVYSVDKTGLEKALIAIDKFNAFMNPICTDTNTTTVILEDKQNVFFSEVEQEFVSKKIDALIQYDKENESDLIETLEALVNHLGARNITATSLYLHRNTLMYRIKKIENLTGYDLSDPESILELSLALRLNKFMNH